jgi:hypothetical protein
MRRGCHSEAPPYVTHEQTSGEEFYALLFPAVLNSRVRERYAQQNRFAASTVVPDISGVSLNRYRQTPSPSRCDDAEAQFQKSFTRRYRLQQRPLPIERGDREKDAI